MLACDETVAGRAVGVEPCFGVTSYSQAQGEVALQDIRLSYDEVGNLMARIRTNPGTTAGYNESFAYDKLDRLTGTVAAPTAITYDASGNILTKDGKTYTYGNCVAGLHAVCSTGGSTFQYDASGNLTSGNDKTMGYNPSNKVISIYSDPATSLGHDTGAVGFIYNADGNRVVQSVSASPGATEMARTVYVGLGATGKSLYERTTRSAPDGTKTIEHAHFLYAGAHRGGSAIALKIVTESGGSSTTAMKYFHTDHLGSVTAISDEAGSVVDPAWDGNASTVMDYDAWGARRNPNGTTASSPTVFDQPIGNRGFTGHETIPDVGLVNMNGRVYDPVIGRFLSPDPNVQFAANLQSYNRYSYVLNNPLSMTDPTGYFSLSGLGAFNIFAGVVSIGVCAGSGGIGCGLAFAALSATINTVAMHQAGMAWDQAIAVNLVGIGAGMVGGAIGGSVGAGVTEGLKYEGSATAAQIAGQVMGGVMGAVASATFASIATGGSISAEGLLTSAFQGALWAGVSYGFAQAATVTQASAQGGRSLYTTEGDLGQLFPSEPTDPLRVSPDTLKTFVAGTDLEGRTTIDELPEGKLGVTNPDGTVVISPKAFRSADALALVIDHEGVHVSQLITGNFNGNSLGKNVNELQAWRSTLRFIDARNGAAEMDGAWAFAVDQVANHFSGIDLGYGGGAYVPNVTGALPYNYSLYPQDACPMTVCNAGAYRR